MKRKLPSFPAIRAFEAAARHHSFTGAADELCVTHSAVSHQIRLLEEFLGVVLFRREARGVSLTAEGATYLTRVSEALDQLAGATHEIRDQRAAGPLYISSTPVFAERWLVPRLNDFNRHYPDIELHVTASRELVDFTDDRADIAIRFGRRLSGDLHVEPFLESPRFPVASPELLEGKPPIRHPSDLCDYVLLHDEDNDEWRQWFACAGAEDVAQSDSGPRFGFCNLALRAALEGQGVALAYGAMVAEDLAAGTLVRLCDVDLPSTVMYSFVCPKSSLSQPRVAAFRSWLTSTVALDGVQSASEHRRAPTASKGRLWEQG
ncbi:MAG: transcriptional regulator GcvA [Gammaproteobacteria bacterium]|nr:transcriptional regulator GcvA [Gammaproteobacteria bacterium]NIR82536.1 transcriptional regulator GcvA [Gammaproteobacteria bacterium]NIR88362.1 transcriptional regulator GcvA [Gammaproteobacteria bacterium]NIU03674.1 transcriptional regulator GcvA [Gammaproteobacteria bacterium]NIV52888.1 transcriptional regulator GcvA [Gammaproteobacteria bacterium]